MRMVSRNVNGTCSGHGRINLLPGGGFFAPVCARAAGDGRGCAGVRAAAAACGSDAPTHDMEGTKSDSSECLAVGTRSFKHVCMHALEGRVGKRIQTG